MFRLVYRHLLVLLDHTYDEVVKMRYNMLWNLYTLARERKCRRTLYLHYFQERVEEGYACGCCDVCSPSLDFLDQRRQPRDSVIAAEQESELRQTFASGRFDLPTLCRLREAFADYSADQYRRALGVLEGNPYNLPALFFAHAFSPDEHYQRNARDLLVGANRKPLALADVKALYASTRTEPRSKLLLTLNETYSACATVDGWRFLAEEARKPEHEGVATIRLLRECLEFMLLVQVDLPRSSESMRRKVGELEEAMYA